MTSPKSIFLTGVLVTMISAFLRGQNAVLTSGDTDYGAGGSVAYSIGQMDFTHFAGEGGSISLGVQQPNVIIMVGTNENEVTLIAGVYPNPTNTSVHLTLEEQSLPPSWTGSLSFELYDIQGKLLLKQELVEKTTSVQMSGLTPSIYILRVLHDQAEIKSFKISKTD